MDQRQYRPVLLSALVLSYILPSSVQRASVCMFLSIYLTIWGLLILHLTRNKVWVSQVGNRLGNGSQLGNWCGLGLCLLAWSESNISFFCMGLIPLFRYDTDLCSESLFVYLDLGTNIWAHENLYCTDKMTKTAVRLDLSSILANFLFRFSWIAQYKWKCWIWEECIIIEYSLRDLEWFKCSAVRKCYTFLDKHSTHLFVIKQSQMFSINIDLSPLPWVALHNWVL